ncbi:MAG: cysteine hydrolase [Sphaerochaetaceae bacterium]|nr:cysteine hydrolase [Sphaerochaetaceae bacterium]
MFKILVVVDVQKDFVDGSLGSKEAVKIVPAVIEAIKENRKNNDYLIFTMDTHGQDYLDTFEGKMLPVPHCIKNTDGWLLDKNIRSMGDCVFDTNCSILEKPGFGCPSLPQTIEEITKNADGDFEVTLCGLCTDICVASNAMLLRALYPSMNIKVLKDACAGSTVENHEAALKVFKACQIVIE